jgi:8-oxo-dGTP pyrophosphatase MutT (NUDIX family)
MTDECYYRVSIKGVAIDETGRFLLARESNGKWELLGGGLDHGEDPIIGLKREIKEETSLEVTYVSSSPKYFVTAQRLGHDTFVANVIYEIKLKDLTFTASDECQELRFFNVEEACKEDLFPNVEKFLDAYDPNLHND